MSLLKIDDLYKSYRAPDGTTTGVLDIATFDLPADQQLAMAGSSGSGKTTLLHIIGGILKPDRGRVMIEDQEITALSESECDRLRADCIGTVFQTFNLLQGYTALENVELGMMFGRGIDRRYARSLLEELGLGNRLHYLPHQLSIGQQQRVALARALANHPRLVLADEPTGNLDRNNATEALRLLRELCKERGAALLLVSHDPHVLEQFDHRLDLAEINRVAASAEAGK